MKLHSILSRFTLITAGFCLLFCVSCMAGLPEPVSLKVGEGFSDPIGFYQNEPVFSWKLPVDKNIKSQSAYEIVAAGSAELLPDSPDLWSSGRVESDQSVWVEYEGPKLDSRRRVYWQVRYWDQRGRVSEWSDKAYFELGLLDNSDWEARWIGDPYEEKPALSRFSTKLYAAQYVRKEFDAEEDIVSARLYITAKGIYEAFINGAKVGNTVMSPGYTPYHKRIETLTYDVTDMLRGGRNAIGVSMAPGWNTSRIAWSPSQYVEKAPPKIICQLEVAFGNGKTAKILSEGSWKSTNKGPVRTSEIYDGEVYDQSMEMPGWSEAGFDDSDWSCVAVEEIDPDVRLQPKRHAPVVNKAELPSQSVTVSESGSAIFDLGQNIVGVPRIKVPMNEGDTLVIRFAEMLRDDGELYIENYRTAHSTDYFIASKNGDIEYVPQFTFHGFRYVGLSGFPPSATPDNSWVSGIVQYSDFDDTGVFVTSDEMLNRLNSNIKWGLRGNFLDIPTDCPQRDERMGWTGDAQIFASTAYFIADVHSFFASWMQSVREEQLPSGGIPIVVPNVSKERVSPGWGDAVAVIPWVAYMRTGDISILEDNYQAMKKWVDFYFTHLRDGIIDLKGFGDWLQPYSSRGNYGDTPDDLIATAYCAYSTQLTMQTAQALGLEREYEELSKRYEQLRGAFENHFFDSEGRIVSVETQTGYLLALGFELLKDQRKISGATKNLVRMIEETDYHLGTGFLGTPLLAPVLDKVGRSDLAYTLLFQTSYPSWFYSIEQGATTMWERWNSYSKEDGFGSAGMNSFNHYAYGAVGQWMYERIAGISPLSPGYMKIRIAPCPGKNLSYARGEYESPYGLIVSEWSLKGRNFNQKTVIPPNTTAEIVIPYGEQVKITVNGYSIGKNGPFRVIDRDGGRTVIEVAAGAYEIRAKIPE